MILEQGFALHHFPSAMCFFRLHKRLPWQKGAASWPDLAKGLTKVFSSTQLMPAKLSIQRKVIVLTLFFHQDLFSRTTANIIFFFLAKKVTKKNPSMLKPYTLKASIILADTTADSHPCSFWSKWSMPLQCCFLSSQKWREMVT